MEIFIGSLDFLKKWFKLIFDILSTSMFKWIISVKKQWAEHKNLNYADMASTVHGTYWELRFLTLREFYQCK